ncbi:CHRD domain-containing protein [Paraglaciecola aquimarina]|uniref:CHRD domain-containing protein n=1 Tax=Paraglaciecola aquimarina TaxID=1235557 RepID=A0ABU3SXP3_9ALTE|nr:CHRD domain-containing protein [Paraglaciecola aquimarina]MDU0354687.1 CHRD domain-containing protein [Paraglaciecola aquimarina]
MKIKLLRVFVVVISLAMSLSTQATVISLTSNLDGAQANAGAGSGSMGTGVASMMFDDATNGFSWKISWSGLTGNVTVAHFHGAALFNQNAGVQLPLSVVANSANGNSVLTDEQATDLLAGLWYINIHTDAFPAGEIRGQVSVPAPSGTFLLIPLMMALYYVRRKQV